MEELGIFKFALSVPAGVIVWIIKEKISQYIFGKRVKAGLIADLNKHIVGASRQVGSLHATKAEFIKFAEHFPYPINYTVGRYNFYAAHQKDLPKYLHESELIDVMTVYQFLWELDLSFEGFVKIINSCESKDKPINRVVIGNLDKHIDAITQGIEVLKVGTIKEFSDIKLIATSIE